jgi:hypothetical protein
MLVKFLNNKVIFPKMIHQYKNVVTDIRDADVGDILLTRMHSKHPGPREVHGSMYGIRSWTNDGIQGWVLPDPTGTVLYEDLDRVDPDTGKLLKPSREERYFFVSRIDDRKGTMKFRAIPLPGPELDERTLDPGYFDAMPVEVGKRYHIIVDQMKARDPEKGKPLFFLPGHDEMYGIILPEEWQNVQPGNVHDVVLVGTLKKKDTQFGTEMKTAYLARIIPHFGGGMEFTVKIAHQEGEEFRAHAPGWNCYVMPPLDRSFEVQPRGEYRVRIDVISDDDLDCIPLDLWDYQGLHMERPTVLATATELVNPPEPRPPQPQGQRRRKSYKEFEPWESRRSFDMDHRS